MEQEDVLATPDRPGEGEAPIGDPLLEGMIEPSDAAPLKSDASLALSDIPVRTDAVTAAIVDPVSGYSYAATRSASPARLYSAPPSPEAATIAKDLPFGTGSWDLALSGTTLAVGTNAPSSHPSTRLLGFNTKTASFTSSVDLPRSSMVMSVVEDTVLSTPGNGRWFWVGTYHKAGAKLFRVNLATGTAIDYTPADAWKTLRYVRTLATDAAGLTIGLGTPAAVWRLDRSSQRLSSWPEATRAFDGRSLAYSAAAIDPSKGEAPIVVIGSEASASVFVGSTPGATPLPAQQRVHFLDGNTVDRITIDPSSAQAWFTVRPDARLYSLDLTDPASTPVAHGTPEPGSETRSLQVVEGMIRGVTGTSEAWTFDPLTSKVLPRRNLVPLSQELRDTIPQGVIEFGDRLLVGGHWRYQVHHDPSMQQIRVPGEPKAQVVVGDKLYSAMYPSATVYELDSSLKVNKVAALGHGQMRPTAITYNPTLQKLAVATGPAYGQYGGGLSLVSPQPDSEPQVYTSPVGRHQVSVIHPVDGELFLGTSTIGEAQPALPGERAKIVRWRGTGDPVTGTTVWSTMLPVNVAKVNGVHLVDDESGQQLVVAADPATGARGWLLGLDPDTGAVLWQQQVDGPIRWMRGSNNYLAIHLSSSIKQVGVTRFGATLTNIRNFGSSIVPSFVSLMEAPQAVQRIAFVSAGANGVTGVAAQGTPRVPSRVEGVNRYATAVAVSRQTYARADTVVLARGDDFADALSAGPLAAALDAPILLVQPGGKLTPETVAEIDRLGASKAVPVGGTGAIPESVSGQLPTGVALDENRPQGANRYETSVAVAKRLESELGGKKRDVFVTTGQDFADAISAVPAAIKDSRSIVLYDDNAKASTAKSFIAARSAHALGGPAVSSMRAAGLNPTHAVLGTDRFDTARQIASRYFERTTRAYIAPGLDFPDGLTAGVLAGQGEAPLLLARSATLTPQTTSALQNGRGTQQITLVGGWGVLGPRIEQAVADIR
ncbi:cell wall-binding repeat-containing protein [Leucobacter sp. USCH14]|uniref:cell wall-binding repeat-containing protein n=1 Tax=Leucobacter sp. USCH14 TaxID=3024838 RepID=UPI0030B46A57